MANANRVEKRIRRALQDSPTRCLKGSSADELKQQVDAEGMKTSTFQQLLTTMKHENAIRGFRFTNGDAYIKA